MAEGSPNGLECFECQAIMDEEQIQNEGFEVEELVDGSLGFECVKCGSDNLGPVEITPCEDVQKALEVGGDPKKVGADCDSDHHHHGRNDHVRSIQR